MSNDNVIKLIQPGMFADHLTDVLRNGACALLTQAVEAEVAEFLGKHADLKTADRLIHNAHRIELSGESLRRTRSKRSKTA